MESDILTKRLVECLEKTSWKLKIPKEPMEIRGGVLRHKYLKRKGYPQYLNVSMKNGELSVNGNRGNTRRWEAYFSVEEVLELDEKYGVLDEFDFVFFNEWGKEEVI